MPSTRTFSRTGSNDDVASFAIERAHGTHADVSATVRTESCRDFNISSKISRVARGDRDFSRVALRRGSSSDQKMPRDTALGRDNPDGTACTTVTGAAAENEGATISAAASVELEPAANLAITGAHLKPAAQRVAVACANPDRAAVSRQRRP